MKNLFKNRKNYRNAQPWLEAVVAKEAKKQALNLEQSSYVPQYSSVNLVTPQIVFTRADMGHNSEETQKIQQIYAELGTVPLSYAFA